MNSKMIRKIIKEELQALLITEKFESKKLSNLYSMLAAERWSGGKTIFTRIAAAKKFDWANAPWFDVNGLSDVPSIDKQTAIQKLQSK